MNGEIVQKIYTPEKGSEWVLIKTNKGLYSMRLGGFKKEMGIQILDNHKEIAFPYENRVVQKIYTDEEWVYLILSNGGVIASGWIDITFWGDLKLGVKFVDITEYEPNFFQSSLFSRLTVAADGWSKSA